MSSPVREDFHDVSLDEWYSIVDRSIREPVIDGIEMPRFPHPAIQRGFVGCSDEHALAIARNFHSYTVKWAAALGHPLGKDSKILDFGSSWGRVIRYFWHEAHAANLYGVDVDFDAVAACRNLGVPGNFSVVTPTGAMPFDGPVMDVIFAVSVFSHLSLKSADHWMAELYRVAKPGCVFAITVESRKFVEEISFIPDDAQSLRQQLLLRHKPRVPEMLNDFDAGNFVFMENGSGGVRDDEFFGDAAISEKFFTTRWGHFFRLCGYVEAHEHLGQAFIIAIKD